MHNKIPATWHCFVSMAFYIVAITKFYKAGSSYGVMDVLRFCFSLLWGE